MRRGIQKTIVALLGFASVAVHAESTSALFFTRVSKANRTMRMRYVDADAGHDGNTGTSPAQAWKTLHHAAGQVVAGDCVAVAPGVYRGGIQLRAKGRPDAPILFLGDGSENGTVVTLADPNIRAGNQSWTLENEETSLYSTSYAGRPPVRVLYSGNDLYPYSSLAGLNSFSTSTDVPGPRHGFFFNKETQRLYLRLHPSGKYGSLDPTEHLIAVSPPTGSRFDGMLVGEPCHYGIGVLDPGDAHVVIDGFTFETPGVAGVYVEANHVTVRRCWFQGCRAGVAGNYRDRLTTDPLGLDYMSLRHDPETRDRSASQITIEYCDFHQKPSFDDAVELMGLLDKSASEDEVYGAFWHRKAAEKGLPNDHYKYEIGMVSRAASNWSLRQNYIHDAFDGLSCHAVSSSLGMRVEQNVFERLLDNGVESEDHAEDMHIFRNVFIDNFSPVSWQPIRGRPWAGPIYITENIMFNTPLYQDLWIDAGFTIRPILKIGVTQKSWKRVPHLLEDKRMEATVPGDGLVVAHNTAVFKGGRTLALIGGLGVDLQNVHIYNNAFVAAYLWDLRPERDLPPGHLDFRSNVVAPSFPGQPGPGSVVAGEKGRVLASSDALMIDQNFRPICDKTKEESPLCDTAIRGAGMGLDLPNIGAIQPGATWYPLSVGPAATNSND